MCSKINVTNSLCELSTYSMMGKKKNPDIIVVQFCLSSNVLRLALSLPVTWHWSDSTGDAEAESCSAPTCAAPASS